MRSSCDAYDGGRRHEARRLSVALRTLLHDTKNQRSLLTQLKVRDRLKFVDTAIYPAQQRGSLVPAFGLVAIDVKSDAYGAMEAEYVAPGLQPLIPPRVRQPRLFAVWWHQVVYELADARPLARVSIVCSVANREGGAHVDPRMDPQYEALVLDNALGWVQTSVDGEVEATGGDAMLASIRQIADEVLATLGAAGLVSASTP